MCENESQLNKASKEERVELKEANAFDPASRQQIKVTIDGEEVIMPICDWLKLIDSNGRGGT